MLLGFMSLILTVTQEYISKICISEKAGETMLPCKKRDASSQSIKVQEYEHVAKVIIRSLKSMNSLLWQPRRRLEDDEEGTTTTNDAGAASADSCSSQVYMFLISEFN